MYTLAQTGGGNVEKRAYKMAKQRVSIIHQQFLLDDELSSPV